MSEATVKSRPFIALNIAVLTVSDTRTLTDDKSGDIIVQRLQASGHKLEDRDIVRDDLDLVADRLKAWINNEKIDVIISTGGTGVTGRDVTPEAFKKVIEKEISGFGELFRMLSFSKIGTSTIQSRAIAGVAKGTYLFAVPGSPSACRDAWDDILSHQLDYRHKPCNFVEIMPRLLEKNLGRSGKK